MRIKKQKKIKGSLIFLVVTLFFCIMNLFYVSAANIGISPATIRFNNVLRGGYAERNVVISIDSEKPIGVELKPRGEIKDWLNFSEVNFNVSRKNPYVLRVGVVPPENMPNGNYTGFLKVATKEFGAGVPGNAVSVVRSTLDLYVTVEVTDIEVKSCSASNFKVNSVELGDDIVFETEIKNSGNILLKPTINIDIWDSDQISIIKSKQFSEKQVMPTLKDKFYLRVSSKDLDLGQYWADISVSECSAGQTLTFDILEPGALRAEGKLLGILTKRYSGAGDTVPIRVRFKNVGEKEVEAQFKGKITRGNKVVQVLESDKRKFPVGNTDEFNFFFTPEKAGKYIISGRVYYAGKKTFESSTVLDVYLKEFTLKSLIVPIIYLILGFIIAWLFYKINKEKKSYSLKLKRLR